MITCNLSTNFKSTRRVLERLTAFLRAARDLLMGLAVLGLYDDKTGTVRVIHLHVTLRVSM